jgi:anti-sigma factor RsiW
VPNPPHLTDEERANLVAYLDGELDRKAAAALESKLARDPCSRAEAESLRQVWQLLDYLPRPEPSAAFTHQTLEQISAQRSARPVRWRRWVVRAGWAAGILIAAAGTYAGSRMLSRAVPVAAVEPAPVTAEAIDQALVRDLGVIENKRLYEHVNDIQFLKRLADPNDPHGFAREGS